jgi:magnesium-transporting ATPase (P-type)
MIPKDFIHKCMFVFLYDFTNKFKSLFLILIVYIFLLFYFSINDGYVIISFVLSYIVIFIKTFSINKTLNKEFERYKKYLRLKRKHHGKN